MKITIKAFLTLRPAMGQQSAFEMETGELTINELLNVLGREFGEEFEKVIFEPCSRNLSVHTRILVNGRHYSTLSEKLETRLKEGDEVAFFPPLAGG